MHLRPVAPELEEASRLFHIKVLPLPFSEPHQLLVVAGEARPFRLGSLLHQEEILRRVPDDQNASDASGEYNLNGVEEEEVDAQFRQRGENRFCY